MSVRTIYCSLKATITRTAGLGNCGLEDVNTDPIVAISKTLYDDNNGDNCNQVRCAFTAGYITIHSSSSGLQSITVTKAFMLRSATVAKAADIMTLVRFTFSCPLEADPEPFGLQICPRRLSKDWRPWQLDKSKFRGASWTSRGGREDCHGQIPSRDICCCHENNRTSELHP